MSTLKSNFWTYVKEYAIMIVGLLLYTGGWTVFLMPNNLISGGVTGISSIIQYATGGVIKAGYSYFVINAILLVIGFWVIGKGFGGKTIFAVAFVSAALVFLPEWIPYEIIDTLAIKNGKLMSVIMGGIMAGVGIGMSISQGGSTGGTDIIALVYTKYRNVSPGKVILALDVVILLSSLLVPSYVKVGDSLELMPFADKITTVVYGLILVTVCSYAIDMYISGSRQSVQLFILSKKYAEIADVITHELHRGVTVLDGKGWYTQHPTEVLLVVTRKSDLNLLLRYIKAIDSEAFLSVSSVNGVYGKGFDTIKLKKRTKS
jgi:uncharacterized membrane-anchored protein YitT (DUF2179 family)